MFLLLAARHARPGPATTLYFGLHFAIALVAMLLTRFHYAVRKSARVRLAAYRRWAIGSERSEATPSKQIDRFILGGSVDRRTKR